MTIIEAMNRNDYYAIYDMYHNKKNKNDVDNSCEYLAFIVCSLINGGNIYTSESNQNSVLDCVYEHDFFKALTLSKDFVELYLLNTIMDLVKDNVKNNYQGKYNQAFYNLIEDIEYSINNNNSDLLASLLIDYLNIIDRPEIIDMLVPIVPFIVNNQEGENLIHIMTSITYPRGKIDQDILVNWYKKSIELKDFDTARNIFCVLISIDPENTKIYQYLYDEVVNRNLSYVVNKINFKNELVSEVNHSLTTNTVVDIYCNDDIDEYIINEVLSTRDDLKHYRGEHAYFISPYKKRSKTIVKDLEKGASKAFKNQDYLQAIRKLKLILSSKKSFKVRILERLMTCYRYNNDYLNEKTISNLITDISKEEPKEQEYTESRTAFNYFIPNIDAIIFEVIEQGSDAISVINKYNLSLEDTIYAYVIIAREYYKKDYQKLGDKFIQLARKLRDKNDHELNEFIKEVEQNKKFYKNRTYESFLDIVKLELNKK